MRLDPSADEQGAVKLYIPTNSIPQDTAQAVDVFYVDESGTIDSFNLIVPERAGTFLADLAANAEPQVKAAYADVTQVNSDTYLEDSAASIRADGVTPLPAAEEVLANSACGLEIDGDIFLACKMSSGRYAILNGITGTKEGDFAYFEYQPSPLPTDVADASEIDFAFIDGTQPPAGALKKDLDIRVEDFVANPETGATYKINGYVDGIKVLSGISQNDASPVGFKLEQ